MGRPKGSKNKNGMPKYLKLTCNVCGKEFESYPAHRKGERKYCSVKCYRISRKGWQPTEETRARLRASRKGKKPTLGKKPSAETRKLLSNALKGPKGPRWKGGVNPANDSFRKSVEYKLWRERVFQRDNYQCRVCGAQNGNGKAVELNAHHIKPFADYPEERINVSNGLTVCEHCHRKIHKNEVLLDEYISEINLCS